MIDKEKAKALVVEKLNSLSPELELAVLDSETINKEWGWVFFYQSKKYLETGDFRDMLGGNAPYIVNKSTGEVVETGTAFDIGHYISEYERSM